MKRKKIVKKILPTREPTKADKDAARERHILDCLVEDLMGKDPSKRFAFIMENAKFVKKEDLDY